MTVNTDIRQSYPTELFATIVPWLTAAFVAQTAVREDGMKLALLGSRGIPAQYGGFETFAEELSVRLVQQGVEVTVYTAQRR